MNKISHVLILIWLCGSCLSPMSLLAQKWQGQVGTQRMLFNLNKDSFQLQLPDSYPGSKFNGVKKENDLFLFDVRGWGMVRLNTSFSSSPGAVIMRNQKDISVKLKPVDRLQAISNNQIESANGLWKVDSVQFYDEQTKISYGADFYKSNNTKQPALILVSGSGQQDRNGTMAGHAYFKVLATHFANRGYSVLTLDDRGKGTTTGSYASATTNDFGKDILAASRFLKGQVGIDTNRIGLIAHSEGAEAALIAQQYDPSIKTIISLSGLLQRGLDALKYQNKSLVSIAKIEEEEKQRSYDLFSFIFDSVYRYADSPNLATITQQSYDVWKKKDDSLFQLRNPGKLDHFRFPIHRFIQQIQTPWYKYHIKSDPSLFIEKMKASLLIVNGSKDVFVDPLQGYAFIKKSRKSKFVIHHELINGLDHLLQYSETGDAAEALWHDSTIAPIVLSILDSWLMKHL